MSEGSYFAESFQYGPAARALPTGSAAALLRARILLHLLFTDRLVIPDSQILNNPHLRQLVSPHEAAGPLPADLDEFVVAGRLAIARRDTMPSLAELHEWQVANRMPDVATPEYARLIDGMVGDQALTWSFEQVSTAFKAGAVAGLRANLGISPEDDRVTEQALRWVERQDVLYYSEFLRWKENVSGVLDGVAVDRVDRIITIAYGLSVPKTLHLDSAAPAGADSPFEHLVLETEADSDRQAESDAVECFTINPFVLARVPAEVILAAVESDERQRIMAEFAKARGGDQPDWSVIANAFPELMTNLNIATLRHLQGEGMDRAVAELRSIRPRARLSWLLKRGGEQVADIVLDVATGGMSGVPSVIAHLSLFGFAVYTGRSDARRASVIEQRQQRDAARVELLMRTTGRATPLLRPPDRGLRLPRQGLRRLVAEPAVLEDAAA
jgi:hypothetical protein